MRAKLLIGLAAAMLLASCGTTVVNPVTGQAERSVMDERAEIAEGAKAHPQVLAEYGRYDNAAVQAYVNDLGQRLAKASHRAHLSWTFTVLDSPEVNAFALPGGYVYVTRGIMAYLGSEAELAGVIGHEIGHVTARHGAQRATRQQTAGLSVLAATVLGAALGVGDLAGQVSQTVAAGYVASYSRDQELQADQLGADYLVRNRYDPRHMVDVIGVLKSQEQFAADDARAQGRSPRGGADWLASHPSNEQRLHDITRIAAQYAQQSGGSFADDGRARYLRAISGITYGDSQAQGVVRGQNFYHEPLGFALTAPAGWSIQNAQEAITLVNAARDAGLVVRLLPAEAGNDHEAIVRKLFEPEQGRLEARRINGLAASHFTGVVANAQGQRRNVAATIINGPNQQNYVLMYAGKDDAALRRAAQPLGETERSFRSLTAADRRAAAPWRVRTTPLPVGGFAQLARQSSLPASTAERQLRLLNGVYGKDQGAPRAGTLVKTVN